MKKRLTRGGSRIFFRRGCTRLLLYFNTNNPHIFFFAEYQLYQKAAGHLRGGGGGCAPPAPSPRSAPANGSLVYIISSCVGVSALTYTEEVNRQKFRSSNTETFQTFSFRNVRQDQARFINQARISFLVAAHPVRVEGPLSRVSRCVPWNSVLLAPKQSTRTERLQELTAFAKVSDQFRLSKKCFNPIGWPF